MSPTVADQMNAQYRSPQVNQPMSPSRLESFTRREVTEEPAIGLPSAEASEKKAGLQSQKGVTQPPSQLPAAVTSFVSRSEEMAVMDEMLMSAKEDARPMISIITGAPGVGKTALALRWAYLRSTKFPDGQLYVNLHGFDNTSNPVTPSEALSIAIRSFGIHPDCVPVQLDEKAAFYRSLIASRRVLIVLDDAYNEDQVRYLLPGSSRCGLIVTSRTRMNGLVATHGFRMIQLKPLTEADSHYLLACQVGVDRLQADPVASAQLNQQCAGLPLALAIVAARVRDNPSFSLDVFASELTDTERRLTALDTGDAKASLRSVFSWSLARLSSIELTVFLCVGILPFQRVSEGVIASMCGVSLPATHKAILALTRANLLMEEKPGQYVCHQLLQLYAAEQVQRSINKTDIRVMTVRFLQYYLHSLNASCRILYPQLDLMIEEDPALGVTIELFESPEQVMRWFEGEHDNVVRTCLSLGRSQFADYVWRMSLMVRMFLAWQGSWDEEKAVLEVALIAAQSEGNCMVEARIHRYLDHLYGRLGDYDRAREHIESARSLYGECGDATGLGYSHLSDAWIYGKEARHADAMASSQQALKFFDVGSHIIGQASAHNSIGWCAAQMRAYDDGRYHCSLALKFARESGNMHAEANALNSLGYIALGEREYGSAIQYLIDALKLVRRLGDRGAIAESLDILGDAYRARNELESASSVWMEALGILEERWDPRRVALVKKLEAL
jgi:hypothetical protein